MVTPSNCHSYETGDVPEALTVNVAAPPWHTVSVTKGCKTILFIVSIATLDSTVFPQLSVTVTLY